MNSRFAFRRRSIQLFSLAFALGLPYLPTGWFLLLCLTAFVHNVLLLPRYAPELFSKNDPYLRSLAYYPLAIAVLLLLFPNHLHIIACAWAILAVGDSFSGLLRHVFPLANLPWNERKTLGGMLAFFLTGAFAGWLFLYFISPDGTLLHCLFVAVVAAFCGAVAESLALPWDDNLTTPLISAAIAYIAWAIDLHAFLEFPNWNWWTAALVVNTVGGFLAHSWGFVSGTGALAGIVIGTIVLAMGGTDQFFLLFVYYVSSLFAMKYGYPYRMMLGNKPTNEGRYGARETYANLWIALASVIFMGMTEGADPLLNVIFCASLATAIADMVSSELGIVYGYQAYMPTTFLPAPPGTPGAISVEGTLLGMGAAFALTCLASLIGVLPLQAVPAVTLGGWLGFYSESYFSAQRTDEGLPVRPRWMNTLNPFLGAVTAVIIATLTEL